MCSGISVNLKLAFGRCATIPHPREPCGIRNAHICTYINIHVYIYSLCEPAMSPRLTPQKHKHSVRETARITPADRNLNIGTPNPQQ